MAVVARTEHNGGAGELTLSAGITAGSTTINTTGVVTNWPAGSTGVFYILVFNFDHTIEEKVRCLSRSGSVLTVDSGGRGADNTSGQAHTAGAKIRHIYTAQEADDANVFLSLPTTKGDIAIATAVDNWSRFPAPANDAILMADSGTSTGWKGAAAATTSELADVSNAEAAGTSDTYARGDHGHNLGIGTTKGDVLAHDGTKMARKAVGSNGAYLQADSTQSDGLKWFTPPMARVTKSAVQSIPNTTDTAVSWNQESYDNDIIHDNATNNSRLTAKTPGKYRIWVNSAWATGAGNRITVLRLNGTTNIGLDRRAGTLEANASLSITWAMALNDYVEVVVHQDSGGGLDFTTAASFGMEYLGP